MTINLVVISTAVLVFFALICAIFQIIKYWKQKKSAKEFMNRPGMTAEEIWMTKNIRRPTKFQEQIATIALEKKMADSLAALELTPGEKRIMLTSEDRKKLGRHRPELL